MYKDVKKKLLSVVLCVCMVIGAVQVVPRAKAAATLNGGYYEITAGFASQPGSETLKVALNYSSSLPYNGSAYAPEVTQVLNQSNQDVTNQFATALKCTGDTTNTGSFYGVLVPVAGSTYTINSDENNRIVFTIEPSRIRDLVIDTGASSGANPVLKYAGNNTVPTFASVKARLYTGATILLSEAQYEVTPITEVGENQICTVTVTDSTNFSNSAEISKPVKYDVAYDLSSYMQLNTAAFTYQDKDLSSSVTFSVYDKDKNTPVSNSLSKNTLGLSVLFNGSANQSVKEAGNYMVSVTPFDGEDSTVTINDVLYTGKFTGSFNVGLKTAGKFVVTATDLDQKKSVELSSDTSSYMYRVPLSGNDAVYPADLLVVVDDIARTKDVDYELYCTNSQDETVIPNKAGRYNLHIKMKPSTNYGDEKVVVYYVYSSLVIQSLRFDGESADKKELKYIGETGRKIAELYVEDVSGNKLTEGANYEVEYWYKNGNNWIQAADYADSNMASVGQKRIVVNGISSYKGESANWEYSIAKVSMEDSAEAQYFELKLKDDTSFDYTGSPITPAYTFKYHNVEIDPSYYTAIWKNNTNAGSATLTVKATGNSPFIGSLSLGFTINALSLSDAECIGDGVNSDPRKYSYTGKPISPQLKINEYELKSSDYTVTKYQTQAGKDLGTIAPTEPGDYQMMIVSRNNNIIGSATINYSIIQRDISQDIGASFYLREGSPVEWQGGVTEPEVVCGSMEMVEGRDYTVRYEHNTAPTTAVSASAIVTGKGYFTGTKTLYFDISKRKISNANVAITPNVTGTAPNYAVTFSGRDEGTKVEKHALVENTDYKVTGIVYETASDYVPTISDLNHLQRAGVYIVTVEGLGNYEGTTEVPVTCGTDISNATISTAGGTLTYDGTEKVPTIRIKVGNQSQITYKSGVDAKFELEFSRNDSDNVPIGYENIYAGTVIVRAVGNTKNGYYGTTTNRVQ